MGVPCAASGMYLVSDGGVMFADIVFNLRRWFLGIRAQDESLMLPALIELVRLGEVVGFSAATLSVIHALSERLQATGCDIGLALPVTGPGGEQSPVERVSFVLAPGQRMPALKDPDARFLAESFGPWRRVQVQLGEAVLVDYGRGFPAVHSRVSGLLFEDAGADGVVLMLH
ncbi:hypothetical protein SAMN02745129_2178 [Ferrimonas marina]|uniref:Uncharacterized protein n=2 Tax=Ferrimonas marina TaxID=299255 RepID=A0A1M5TKB3_9GAMM|nr:hypothetical protein SAMN02745129_2178 [Ferrimonas marina]